MWSYLGPQLARSGPLCLVTFCLPEARSFPPLPPCTPLCLLCTGVGKRLCHWPLTWAPACQARAPVVMIVLFIVLARNKLRNFEWPPPMVAVCGNFAHIKAYTLQVRAPPRARGRRGPGRRRVLRKLLGWSGHGGVFGPDKSWGNRWEEKRRREALSLSLTPPLRA